MKTLFTKSTFLCCFQDSCLELCSTCLYLFSCSIMLWFCVLQHARLPCPLPFPGICSNSYPLSQWCHPIISSSVILLSSFLQSLPASGYFPVSQFFVSPSQSTGASVSASVLPMNIQDWFPLGLTELISLQSKDSQDSSPTPQFEGINSSVLSFLLSSSHVCSWLLEKL